MSKLVHTATLCFLCLTLATAVPALACPDKIVCEKNAPGPDQTFTAGVISWPTCYKISAGTCRPRHCDNARDLSDKYWDNRCKERFPRKCTGENGSNICTAHFPVW